MKKVLLLVLLVSLSMSAQYHKFEFNTIRYGDSSGRLGIQHYSKSTIEIYFENEKQYLAWTTADGVTNRALIISIPEKKTDNTNEDYILYKLAFSNGNRSVAMFYQNPKIGLLLIEGKNITFLTI